MDPSLPCPEAGLGFCKGDILHVLDRDDPEWWQAAKEGNSLKTGLIPSLLRQLRNEHTQCSKSRSSKRVGTLTNFRRKIKSQKTLYDAYRVHDYGTEDVHPYEEVVKIAPQNNRPRPLILVATHPIVQLQAIMDQLMATDSNHFSLPRRQPHSLSRNEVVNIDDVLTVIASGKTCLFSIPPQAIRLYRTAEIRPFVAFFNPVFTENSLLYTGNEGKRLSKESALVKEKYNHLFDQILNYSDVQTGIRDISKIARRLRRDFQWVPANWVHTPFP
jgi:MAGUK p55 subfamily protein 5